MVHPAIPMDLLRKTNKSATIIQNNFKTIIEVSLQIVAGVTQAVRHLKVVGATKDRICK